MKNDEIVDSSKEYDAAYDVVRHAMTLVPEFNLQRLKNVLHIASSFVNDELDEMPEEAADLGLNKWLAEDAEDDEKDGL